MGLFSKLFGGGGGGASVIAPRISTPKYDQFGFGLTNMGQQLAGAQRQQQQQANQYSSQIPGLLADIGKAPTLGAAENEELDIASKVYSRLLKDAQLNVFNSVGNQTAGALSNIAGGNVSTKGAFAANVASGIQAKGQESLNTYAGQTATSLLGMRANLLQQVMERSINKLNATQAVQAQAAGQASGIYGTLSGADAARRQEIFNTNAYNAQMKFAADSLNAQMKSSSRNALMGGLFGLGSTALGGGFGALGQIGAAKFGG